MVLEMVKGYDNIRINYHSLLDLPFNEGVGTLAHDIAKPHHRDVTLVGPPTWGAWPLSNTPTLFFNGVTDYLECTAAATADLDFTSADYSLVVWTYHTVSVLSDIILGRYAVNIDGWEFYFGASALGNLNLRHSHSSLGAGDLSDSCYSNGWTDDKWHLVGLSRSGLYPLMYRDGLPVVMNYGPNGMRDPDPCNRDLVIGTRFTKNTNWFHGYMKQPRVISGSLSPSDHWQIFEIERHLFGV